MKIKIFLPIIFVLLFLSALGSFVYWRINTDAGGNTAMKKPETTPENANSNPPAAQAIPIETERAFSGDLIIRISTQGILKANKDVIVVPMVGGRVIEMPVREGTKVKQGDLLFAIDDYEYRLSYRDAKAKLTLAGIDYVSLGGGDGKNGARDSLSVGNNEQEGRYASFVRKAQEDWKTIQNSDTGSINNELRELYEKNLNVSLLLNKSRDAIVADRVGLTAAEINFARAEEDLKNTRVTAPFDGEIASLKIENFQIVSQGEECLRLIDRSLVRVKAQVLESEIRRIKVGNTASIILSSYPGNVYQGRVESVSPVIDEALKTAEVMVSLKNPRGDLEPGLSARVVIDAAVYKNRLLIPKDAVLMRNERKVIFIIRNKRAVWNYVDTGLENEEHVEILRSDYDLKSGDDVAVEGHFTLSHDAAVEAVTRAE